MEKKIYRQENAIQIIPLERCFHRRAKYPNGTQWMHLENRKWCCIADGSGNKAGRRMLGSEYNTLQLGNAI